MFCKDDQPESICSLMPAELPSDAVGDGRYKLTAQTQVGAQLEGVFLRAVVFASHVPLKLIH